MAYRAKGRMIIDKVSEDGKRIKGPVKAWRLANPGKLTFDSMPEYQVWKEIIKAKEPHVYQPKVELFDSKKTMEFVDGELKMTTQRKIGYTPDFYLTKHKVYIEVKGYADDLFKMRWKLFKLKGYKGYIVYSLAEFKKLLKILNKT